MSHSQNQISLARTMSRNTMFGVGERVYRMGVMLALMGFIVDRVGKDGFGLW